jgi:hypothetical protein
MSVNFDEMLALADVDPKAAARAERLAERRMHHAIRRRRRLSEETEIDPRVVAYVQELDAMANAMGDQIEALYAQANAAASIDPLTAGDLQAAAGDLRVALGKVYAQIDRAKERIAPVHPRSVAP